MNRPVYEIAQEIRRTWKPKKARPGEVYYAAEPYLQAMECMRQVEDNYGYDKGSSIVIYFLSNATTWRGADAKRIKKELKALLED